MYKDIVYHLDTQDYLFDRFLETAHGSSFVTFRFATLVVCLFFFAVASVLYFRMKNVANEHQRSPAGNRRVILLFLLVGCIFLFVLYAVHPLMAWDYMDLSYINESRHVNLQQLIAGRNYMANWHLPGYQLFLHLFMRVFGESRAVLLLVNFLFVAVSIIPFQRMCAANMTQTTAFFAMMSFLASPIVLYSLYRITPYPLLMAGNILLVWLVVLYLEQGKKRYYGLMLLLSGVLLLFHLYSFFVVLAVIFLMYFYLRVTIAEKIRVLLPLIMVFAGAFFINVLPIFFYYRDMYNISTPTTERLQVYYWMSHGNLEYIPFMTMIVLNLFLSFLSTTAGVALIGGVLFLVGMYFLFRNGRYRLMFMLLGISSIVVFVGKEALVYLDLNAYTMPYRVLTVLFPFFFIVIFIGVERLGGIVGGFFGRRMAGSVAAVVIFTGLYAYHAPGALRFLQSPDILSAIRYVVDRAEEYDGMIPGNIYFYNEYTSLFFRVRSQDYTAVEKYARFDKTSFGKYLWHDRWYRIERPTEATVHNVLLDMTSVNVNFEQLVKNNFVGRIWYIDNDIRTFGMYPDISDAYRKSIHRALRSMKRVETAHFKGVEVKLYEAAHSTGMWRDNRLTIRAGANDYYYLRGVEPHTNFYSEKRKFTPDAELKVALPDSVEQVTVVFEITGNGHSASGEITDLTTGISHNPINADPVRPIYIIPITSGQRFLHLGFNAFGGGEYKVIQLHLKRQGI